MAGIPDFDQGPMNPEELNRMKKIGDVLP